MTRGLTQTVVLGFALVVGCGKNDMTEDEFIEQHTRSSCRFSYKCCDAAERLSLKDKSTDETDCFAKWLSDFRWIIKLGSTYGGGVFDSGAANACLAEMDARASSCSRHALALPRKALRGSEWVDFVWRSRAHPLKMGLPSRSSS
jgi:hypothetical protein